MSRKRSRTAGIKHAGPYHVQSYSQMGIGFVYFVVFPAFPDYNDATMPDWVKSRGDARGGGPGILTAMGTAQEIEDFLNVPYAPEDVAAWKERRKPTFAPSEKDMSPAMRRIRREARRRDAT